MPGSLAASVRAKFPGAYDDLTDQQLEAKILEKYPGYADLAQQQNPTADMLARRGFLARATTENPADNEPGTFEGMQRGTIEDLGAPSTSRFDAARKLVPYAIPGGPSAEGVTGELIPEIKRMVGSVEGRNPLQWIRNYRATMPSQMAKDTEAFLGRSTPPAPTIPTAAPLQPDALDRALEVARQARKPQGAAPRLVKGSAPTTTDALRSALEDARGTVSEPGTTPPAPTQTPAGKPSVTPGQYDQIQAGASSTQPSPATAAPAPKPATSLPRKMNGKASILADTPPDPAVDDIVNRMAGGPNAPSKGNGTGGPDLKADLDRLRRTYGADRIANAINPQAPEPVIGKIVQQTGAPSAMPDIAQKALLDHLNNPGTIKNPGNFHRALSQLLREYKRNGSAANSDVAKQVADTLRKYGYDVP